MKVKNEQSMFKYKCANGHEFNEGHAKHYLDRSVIGCCPICESDESSELPAAARHIEPPPKAIIPTNVLRKIAKKYNLGHVIMFASEDNRKVHHVVTYGESLTQSGEAAEFGNTLKDALGWPESFHAQSPRINKLIRDNEALYKFFSQIVMAKENTFEDDMRTSITIAIAQLEVVLFDAMEQGIKHIISKYLKRKDQ